MELRRQDYDGLAVRLWGAELREISQCPQLFLLSHERPPSLRTAGRADIRSKPTFHSHITAIQTDSGCPHLAERQHKPWQEVEGHRDSFSVVKTLLGDMLSMYGSSSIAK